MIGKNIISINLKLKIVELVGLPGNEGGIAGRERPRIITGERPDFSDSH